MRTSQCTFSLPPQVSARACGALSISLPSAPLSSFLPSSRRSHFLFFPLHLFFSKRKAKTPQQLCATRNTNCAARNNQHASRKREKERSVGRGGGKGLRAAGAPLTWQRCSGRSMRATRQAKQGKRSEPRGRGEEGRREGGEKGKGGGKRGKGGGVRGEGGGERGEGGGAACRRCAAHLAKMQRAERATRQAKQGKRSPAMVG